MPAFTPLYAQNIDSLKQIAAKRAIGKARDLRDSVAAGLLLTNIGEAHYFKGNYDSASYYFYKALRFLENKDKNGAALTFNALGKLFRKTRELDKALTNYDRAMQLYRELNDSAGIQMIWNESGVVFEYKEDFEEAIRRYSISLQLARARHDKNGEAYALSNIAGLRMLQKSYSDAMQYIDEAQRIRTELKDTFALALGYSDRGSLLMEMKRYSEAGKSILQSNELATKLKYPGLLGANYQLLADLHKRQGDFETALSYSELASVMRDSIFGLAKTEQIQELNARYETDKKEQKIALQQVAISRRNYIIGGTIAILALMMILGIQVYRKRKLQEERRIQAALMKQQEEAGRAILEAEERERQRIGQDLHDGVGQMMSAAKINLSGFLSGIEISDAEEKIRMDNILSLIDESCREVRAVSHSMMPNALLKAGLASAVRDFVSKIDSRIIEANLYTEGLDERLDMSTETVLYRVIQECVNNVIKHAGAARLDISIIRDDEGITATIEDNGKGFDPADAGIRNGIGLKNIESRIQYLKGEVNIDSRPGHGTVVMISVPPR